MLAARPGTTLADVRTVATHPHAEAQCRGWLLATLPGVDVLPSASTSTAARDVAAGTYDAAVCAALAAEVHGLAVLADDVADNGGGVTRFVVVAPRSAPGRRRPAPTGPRWCCSSGRMRPGALLAMLTEFAARGVNLTRLESRPTGAGLGSYCFHLDADGQHRRRPGRPGADRAAAHLRRRPGAGQLSARRRRRRAGRCPAGNADGDYTAAEEWLAAVRAGTAG